jgi:alkylhydroperoxidase family enzyme
MARVAYFDEKKHPELAPLVEKIKAERGGKLLNLYRILLHSPPLVEGWLKLFTAIRQQCKLHGHYRELAIMRVAVVNGADYEFRAHVPFALKGGMTQAQIDALPKWEASGLFDDKERAVLGYTDSMTREIHVPDAIFAPLKKHFDEQELVELTATIAGYNLVSRFLEAMQVDHDRPKPG